MLPAKEPAEAGVCSRGGPGSYASLSASSCATDGKSLDLSEPELVHLLGQVVLSVRLTVLL